MPEAKQTLLSILQEARTWLALPDNDFGWSRWKDSNEALADLDRHIQNIREDRGFTPIDLAGLFAPTGPIQEVSISSGWGTPFLDLAARFDGAHAAYQSSLRG